jgi:hypothetical protein
MGHRLFADVNVRSVGEEDEVKEDEVDRSGL